jgi:hypothetical protein
LYCGKSVSDEGLLVILNSMQGSLKADLIAEILSFKLDLIEHIDGMGAEISTHIQGVDTGIVERLDRIVTKLDGNCDLLEGALRSSARAIEWSEIGPKSGK